ncbi:MAG TPA: hypothetical protein VLH15_04670, partial [Dehalococcoidales bacterium]|nr:hypothetical protein [Dehalococcoidales bacterium]
RGPVLFTNGRDTQQSKILINGGLGGFVSLTAGFKDVMLEASKGEAEASGGGEANTCGHGCSRAPSHPVTPSISQFSRIFLRNPEGQSLISE